MNNIGNLYMDLGRYEEAEMQFEKVLELCAGSQVKYRDYAERLAKMYQGQNYLALGHYEIDIYSDLI